MLTDISVIQGDKKQLKGGNFSTVRINDPQAQETCNYFSKGLVPLEQYSKVVVVRSMEGITMQSKSL